MTLQRRTLNVLQTLTPGARKVLVAVSGGADSVALLRLLEGGDVRLEVAHFNHALRDESGEDAEFVRRLAESLELPFHTERAEVARIAEAKGWNLEDAARRLRYGFLTRTAKRVGADAVVTGHTQDDQAETVIMQLLRGAAFLTGMSATRGQVVRPLLGVSREALLEYLEILDQSFREDASNSDTSRTRTWLRREILPLLETRYPHIKATLARLATLQEAQKAHFDDAVKGLLEDDGIAVSALQRADVAVQRQAIVELLKRADAPVTTKAIEHVLAALDNSKPTRISLTKSLTARVAYGKISVTEKSQVESYGLRVAGMDELPPEVEPGVLERYPDLVIRNRQPGDRITLSGGTKKLSDLLIDRKVPREERDSLRLLASGQRVLWVEGVAVDPSVARAVQDDDVSWMRRALACAERAAKEGELPVGAVVIKAGEVIAEAHNETEAQNDPTAHAEVLALRRAAQVLGDWRLTDCTLYVTLEPCPMCFGACLQAHLPRLVYGAANRREGALESVAALNDAPWKRRLEVKQGVLAGASRVLLKAFFREKR